LGFYASEIAEKQGGDGGVGQTGRGWADTTAKVQKRKCIFDHFLPTLPPPNSVDTDLVATPTFTPPQTSGVDLMAMEVVAKPHLSHLQ